MSNPLSQLLSNFHIRDIQPSDNPELAVIVRNTLTEFGANVPGTVFFDPTTDALFELFQTEKSAYYVAEIEGKLLGGGGIFPTEGLPQNTCELVKMYLLPEARGIGLGRMLMERCLETARNYGFQQIYLETLPELNLAVKVYEKFGFEYLSAPLGNSKHFGCGLWMLKKL
ncbi:MAG: GNAT family N-acetyltransferase [Bacteroidota bacterium]|nr:GNAT family N-acetyltransferase [Bacteroidota bacterium]MDP3434702.1 GNAT family N-acetyltransferase [Bacteroidota bacterium]